MDEAKGKDTFAGSDKIKSFITAPNIIFEKKGIDGMTLKNCGRMIFFSNSDNCVLIEQTDRRLLAMECSPEMANNTKYMMALLKAFNDPQMVRDFYLFLKHRDISKFDSTNDRPITQFYKELRSVTIPSETKYFNDKCSTWESEQGLTSTIKASGKEHYELYKRWCCDIMPTPYKPIAELSFIKRLNDKDKQEFITKTKNCNIFYCIDVAKLRLYIDKNTVEYQEVEEDIYPDKYSL